jgi:hypothetical protein
LLASSASSKEATVGFTCMAGGSTFSTASWFQDAAGDERDTILGRPPDYRVPRPETVTPPAIGEDALGLGWQADALTT